MPSFTLQPLPPSFTDTVGALHRLAEQVVSPARKPDHEIALQRTPRGWGTPPFEWEGAVQQVRVDGAELVFERREPLHVDPVAGELWNATAFPGAELGYAELMAAADPHAAALEFFTTRKEALR